MGAVGPGARDMVVHWGRDSPCFGFKRGQHCLGAMLDKAVVHFIVTFNKQDVRLKPRYTE